MAHRIGRAAGAAVARLGMPFLLLLAGTATAEEPRVARVEVVGLAPVYGLGIDRDLLPYPVQLASDKAIRKAGGENLAEFMAHNLSGVNANEISGSPFQSDITFRGFRASSILGSSQGISIYLDGVRVNEPFGDVINWDMMPEAAIGDLALVTGANPLYGLNTLGGALAFRTKSGLTDPGGELELSVSSQGRRRSDIAYGWQGSGGWHGFIGATLFDDTGWRAHSAGRLGNMLAKLGQASGATEWSASLLAGRSRVLGNGLLPDLLYRDERSAVYTYPDTTRNHLVQGTFNLTHRLARDSELSAVAYVRNSRRETVNGDVSEDYGDYAEDCAAGFGADGAPREPASCGVTREQGAAMHAGVLNTTSTRQNGSGASLAFGTRRGILRLDGGASLDRSDVEYAQFAQAAFVTAAREVIGDPLESRESTSSVVGKSRTAGVYLSASMEVAPGTQLTASARYGHTRVENTLSNERGVQPREGFSYRRLNPALGFTHVLLPRVTLFANLAQGSRVPTVIELGCADPDNPCRLPVGLQSDPYLKQVVARTMEAGARGRFQQDGVSGSYSLSLHRTVNRDDILFLSSPSRQGYFSNFERTRHQGLDAMLSRQSGRLGLRLAYSYLQAVYDADGELFTGARHVQIRRGTRMAGLPRHTGKLSLDWNTSPALTLGMDIHAVSSLVTQGNEDGLIEDAEDGKDAQRADRRVHGYMLLGLRASYRPADQWEFFARISNVFDRRYETFGALAPDLFPHGRLLAPHEQAGEAEQARFVAPGAPRAVVAGLRYRF
ncbi:TonB-dependent receptor [Massilia sp. 2TAF26]|uniref:TonB-dependent receptor n=1 Tax=Massilia sp. 2TAF26 TaxID=3233012 RepID=UPI003F990395